MYFCQLFFANLEMIDLNMLNYKSALNKKIHESKIIEVFYWYESKFYSTSQEDCIIIIGFITNN